MMTKNSRYRRQKQYTEEICSVPVIEHQLPGDSSMITCDIAESLHERFLDHSLHCELLHPAKAAGAQELEWGSLVAAGSSS
jgi:hypothetical protein